jgi:methionine synthase II (cobalamin-independent)
LFATLLGPLPRPPLADDAEPGELLLAVVRAQEAAGLEPVTDGGFGIGSSLAERWRATAALTDRPVKQVTVGPCSLGLGAAQVGDRGQNATPGADPPDAHALAGSVMAAAERLNGELLALSVAGCSLIEIHEPWAARIGTNEQLREVFREAHLRLLRGVAGPHLSLAITNGSADAAGMETLFAAPYASLAVDLIEGPDNWRLVAETPGDRGVVCGALSVERESDDRPEVLIWAAGYAASTGGRGPSRVGLATASSLAHLPWEVAVRKLRVLGEAARLADLPPAERRLQLDPRAVDIRSAALGRVDPGRRPKPNRKRPDQA